MVSFDLPDRQAGQLSLLSFKNHGITVSIAQNVVKAFLIDLSVYKLACRTIQNKPPAMDSRAEGSTKSRRIRTFIKRQMKIKNCFFHCASAFFLNFWPSQKLLLESSRQK